MEKRVTVRLSEGDFRRLEKRAEVEGATLAETLRQVWIDENKSSELETRLTARIKNLEKQQHEMTQMLDDFVGKVYEAQKFTLPRIDAIYKAQVKK